MTYHNRRGKDHTLLESPADWISPNSEGGFRDDPPDLQGAKVVLSDTDHLWGNRVFQQHTAAVTVEDGERNVVARQLQISDAPSRIGPAEIARLASARSAYR